MRLTLCFLIGACILASACKKDLSASGTPPTVTLEFSNVVNSAPFELNTTYTDFDNESYTVTAFKYYISNVSLISLSGAYQQIHGIYHLVDASDSASLNLSFSASADSIVAISFMIGVDSAANVSGSQTGDLSPSKGMYLSKSAGYIMAKLEGTSPALGTAGDVFQYDINGFTGPYNVLRTVTLPLPSGPVSLQPIKSDTLVLSISANVNAWFFGPHALNIASNPSCTTPGTLAGEFADNYASMFSLTNAALK